MAVSTSKTITQKVHGTGIAQCGSYPVITAKFTITFTRATPTDPTVSWKITMASRSDILPTSTTASFGYHFFCYVRLNNTGDFYTIIEKNNNQGPGWTSSNYTKIYNKSGSITSTASTATVTIYTKSKQCMHDNNTGYCYNGTTSYNSNKYTYIKAYEVALPPYVSQYTVTYNPNNGQDAPESQTKEYGEDLTLSTTEPIFPCLINYHNIINPITDTLYRPFLEWNDKQDGSGTSYAPGATYSADANLDLYAQWGNASLNPRSLDLQYITVTYSVGEGVTPPTPTEHALTELGYSTAQGSTIVSYEVGTTYNTITSGLDLYPVYGDATVAYATLPTPTKQGYKFDGWYRDAELTDKVTADILTSTNITLYAKWTFLPVRYFDGNNWTELGQFVWRFNGTEWQKVAHVYQFGGVEWIDQSKVDPFGIYNYGGITGLRPEFAEGVAYGTQENKWQITDSMIFRPGIDGNSAVTLGGICYRGAYNYLCVDCESIDHGWAYVTAAFGIRYASRGKGEDVYLEDMDVRCTIVDSVNPSLSRQILRLSLSNVEQLPFYLRFHGCDSKPIIYSIWFE